MSKLRSINTSIWADTWFEGLTPSQKLLFLYFLTNERTNMLGVYEISIRKVSFETGIPIPEIEESLKTFESDKKIRYVENRVILRNYLKHQKFNKNMKISALRSYNDLPDYLKIPDINTLDASEDNASEGFETLTERFGILRKVEVEEETQTQGETQSESNAPKSARDTAKELQSKTETTGETPPTASVSFGGAADLDVWPTFDDFWEVYDKKTGREPCEKKWKKLKQSEKEIIMQHVPAYVESTPDKSFRKNPQTYLNQKTWTDEEIIIKNPFKNGQENFNNLDPKAVAEYVRAVRNGTA